MADTVVQYVLRVDSKAAQKALDSTAKEADDLTKSLDKLGNESKDASKDLDETEKSSKKTSKGLQGLKVAGAAAAGALAGIATVAVGTIATVGALGSAYIDAQKAAFDFTRQVVDNVNELNDLSAQSGLTAGSIQAVITAFEGSGQSAQAASAFIGRFPRLFADLASGASRASESAARLGISLTDAEGNIKSADTVLIDVTRALQSIEDPTERATEGFLLLGRQAGQFLQAFGATSEFENFLSITERFGVETGPEASAAAARFQEQLAFLNVVVKGLQQRFVNAVGGVDFFNDKLLQAIKIVVTLQDFVAENEAQFKQLGNALKVAGADVLTFFQQALPGFASFVNATFGLVTDQIVNTALLLRELGIVSNETFNAFSTGARSVQDAVSTLADITTNLGAVDFTGETGAGVGGRTGAQDVEGFLDVLLAGVGDGAKEARPPVEDLATAIDEAGKAADNSADLFLDLDKAVPDALQLIEDISAEFSGVSREVLAAQKTVSELENAILDLQIAGLGSTKAQGLLTEAERRLAEAREDAKNKADEAARQAKQDDFDAAAGIVDAVANLDVAQLASFVNPALGAIASTLITLGEKSPEQIREEALAQAEAIKNGIAVLPELIFSIAPQLGVALAEAFIDGIQLLFVNLIDGIKDAFTFFRSTTGQERRERRRSTIADFFDRDVSASFMGGGRFVPSAQGGIRFTGMQDGLAMLHRGEFVVPQSGQRPQQVDRQLNRTTGGGMTININSAVVDRNAVDALVREIEIRFNNQFGTSSSSLFGGR